MFTMSGKFGSAIIYASRVDQESIRQIQTFLNLPMSKGADIRIMPDVHAGKGCVIGYTAKLNDYIVPNLVGVDIGCGVASWICKGTPPPFDELDSFIRECIPSGHNVHTSTNTVAAKLMDTTFFYELKEIVKRTKQDFDYVLGSLGTLGGGNHFIEINKLDNYDGFAVTIHSGSRNFGLKVAKYWQGIAEQKCKVSKDTLRPIIEDLKTKFSGKELEKAIKRASSELKVPKGLEYLTGDDAEGYLHDMSFAQKFASINRITIAHMIIRGFMLEVKQKIESVHNYIDFEDRVLRKGAIAARKGQPVVIPLHMAAGIVLGIGKGNPEWNQSAPHGAGRVLSRSQAKQSLDVEAFKEVMDNAGVWSSCVGRGTLDASPMAYKPPEEILEYLEQTVDIKALARPIYNFKGSEEQQQPIRMQCVIPGNGNE